MRQSGGVLALLPLLFCASSGPPIERPLHILFLGNSYTASAGGQPNLVAELLTASGRSVKTSEFTAGGETLRGHLATNRGEVPPWRAAETRKRARAAAATGRSGSLDRARDAQTLEFAAQAGQLDAAVEAGAPWNYAVLQPGKGLLAPDAYGLPGALAEVATRIRTTSPDATLVLYAAWADPLDGDDQPHVDTGARKLARDNTLVFAPVGTAMHRAWAERPDLDLFVDPGDPHPGRDGAYLIACVLFAALTGESPVGLPSHLDTTYVVFPNLERLRRTITFDLPTEDARYLQKVAWSAYGGTAQQESP
ncbi:hypothetical protein MK489_07580 [Myxococcota bacterium]|nr:hypothetical protein [Myxococcota bacterium]